MAIVRPSTGVPSARTLARHIEKRVNAEREELRLQLHKHMDGGGQFSLTTDGWGAKNRREFAAVTIHYIGLDWRTHDSKLLDMIYLEEPVHSGEYSAEKLLQVTNAFGITSSEFTITGNNAKPNESMLDRFETASHDIAHTSLQSWKFTRKEGDVRCMAHILNLAVQDALKSITAAPSDDTEIYHVEESRAELLDDYEQT